MDLVTDLRSVTCCFSGHRNIPKEKVSAIHESLDKAVVKLIEAGYRRFIAGGAVGFDTKAALTVLFLRKKYPDIKLLLALPYPGQADRWSMADRTFYKVIEKAADHVVYISDRYCRGCMHIRNRYMVDNSSVCVCYLTEDKGGTYSTVKYAAKKGVAVINLADEIAEQ